MSALVNLVGKRCGTMEPVGREGVGSENRPTSSADPEDFDSFVDAVFAEDLQADINENLMVDEDDYESFVESYDALENR
ncbi:MAG: hypothetical protein HUU19_02175 [Phycisphaerales bacterium]|nr:hypothetical protein [Phycisphaerales bacterium]